MILALSDTYHAYKVYRDIWCCNALRRQ